jgi:4-aminobutyrate aminotransferase-like enzyme
VGGASGAVSRIVPPLTITSDEIDRFVEALDAALAARPAARTAGA